MFHRALTPLTHGDDDADALEEFCTRSVSQRPCHAAMRAILRGSTTEGGKNFPGARRGSRENSPTRPIGGEH